MKTKNLSWKWHEQNTREEHLEEKTLARHKKTLRASAGALAIALLIGLNSCGSAGNPNSPSSEQSAGVTSAQDESTQTETGQDQSTQDEIAQIGTEQDKPVQIKPAQESVATSTGQQDTAPFVGAPAGTANQSKAVDLASIPAFSGEPYVALNGNVPGFSDSDLTTSSFESYSEMDSLGRCGTAYACIGTDLMPTEERGEIGQVRPSGWHTIKYDIIDGIYLYNRCHLIGYQLAGENANVQNLITGTRYMNNEGMLPFEEMVADYVKETGNHVLYRVTPVFEGNNLLASGVHMEAESVEDKGDGISFNVYCYNVQPGIRIDYASGDSELDETAYADSERSGQEAAANTDNSARDGQETADNTDNDANSAENTTASYILNTNTHKFHYPYCSSVDQMSEKNKEEFKGTREDAIAMGYEPCKRCNP